MKKTKQALSINSFEQAISKLEEKSDVFPTEAIKYLFDLECDKRIIKKIYYHLSNYREKKLYYNKQSKYGQNTPLYFLILADKHHDESLIDPCINLYTEPNSPDHINLYDQGSLLLTVFCRNYADIAIPKIYDALDLVSDTDISAPLIYLAEVFYYAHTGKYKKKILKILAKDEFSDYDFLVLKAAELQIKEVRPLLKNKLINDRSEKLNQMNPSFYETIVEALYIFDTGDVDHTTPDQQYESLKDWTRWLSLIE